MWVRGLKLVQTEVRINLRLSHPMWVRGLKLSIDINIRNLMWSHPMWVRGLKQTMNANKIRFFSNFSTKPQFLYEGAIFLRKFNIKN